MTNVLVSACLLGMNCRYNGVVKENANVLALLKRKDINLIPICPEQMGGLATPRDPSERQADGRVVMKTGRDVTREYRQGAMDALKIAQLYGCRIALLKERSPSCGKNKVYDGSFSGVLKDGSGVAAELLIEHGIRVFGESELEELLTAL